MASVPPWRVKHERATVSWALCWSINYGCFCGILVRVSCSSRDHLAYRVNHHYYWFLVEKASLPLKLLLASSCSSVGITASFPMTKLTQRQIYSQITHTYIPRCHDHSEGLSPLEYMFPAHVLVSLMKAANCMDHIVL